MLYSLYTHLLYVYRFAAFKYLYIHCNRFIIRIIDRGYVNCECTCVLIPISKLNISKRTHLAHSKNICVLQLKSNFRKLSTFVAIVIVNNSNQMSNELRLTKHIEWTTAILNEKFFLDHTKECCESFYAFVRFGKKNGNWCTGNRFPRSICRMMNISRFLQLENYTLFKDWNDQHDNELFEWEQ